MQTSKPPSLLESLGYQVLSLENGVYVLQTMSADDDSRFVGILITPFPLMTPMVPVQLFLQEVPDAVAAVDIVALWHDLDARRFEETGLDPVSLEAGPVNESAVVREQIERPGGGHRYLFSLSSGDQVCFN